MVPKALAYYRSIRATPKAKIRPLTQKTSYALAVLFISGVIAFLSTLPVFAPANIFRLTQSRLHTNGGVLLTRLAALRPTTAFDERLREIFDKGGLDARLLYVRFGPDVLVNCPLASAGDIGASRNFLLYAAPSILTPHMLHLFALGVATSRFLSGAEGARWRTVAAISGLVLGAAEFWFIAYYDDRTNIKSTRLSEIDFIYWKMLVWRGLAIACFDGILGWVIWLQATGRAFLTPAPTSERLLDHAKRLELLVGKSRSLGILRNGSLRDAGLRRRVDDFWVKDAEVMADVFEEPDVLEAQRAALKKVDVARVQRDADRFLEGIFPGAMPRAVDTP